MPRLIIGLLMSCLCTTVFSSAFAGPSCEKVYENAMQRLYMMELKLYQIDNKEQYRQSVKQRFKDVEALLIATEDCEQAKHTSQEFLVNWQQMYMTLTALQASAQSSAFSDFRDWFTTKEQEIEIFEFAHDKRW